MALSNWLTRQEWNGAYFLYLCEAVQGNVKYPCDLSMHLRGGICQMTRAGYTDWSGITVGNVNDLGSVSKSEDTRYGALACTAEGDNARCLAEIITGTFDPDARLVEFLAWSQTRTDLNLAPYRKVLDAFVKLRLAN